MFELQYFPVFCLVGRFLKQTEVVEMFQTKVVADFAFLQSFCCTSRFSPNVTQSSRQRWAIFEPTLISQLLSWNHVSIYGRCVVFRQGSSFTGGLKGQSFLPKVVAKSSGGGFSLPPGGPGLSDPPPHLSVSNPGWPPLTRVFHPSVPPRPILPLWG